MQVVSWLPVQELPFAAPSRAPVESGVLPEAITPPAPDQPTSQAPDVPRGQPLCPAPSAVLAREPQTAREEQVAPPRKAAVVVPRFSLQLYRAGACLLLVELPTGEAFQSRDPAYLLLKDLLRAAGLPDSPQLLGEPVRWPLLASGSLDQGVEAARDFLRSFLAARVEEEPCTCLWLLGQAALRHAGEVDEAMYNRELQIDGIGPAWALPGLELLMDEPQRKAPLWQAMRRVMQCWKPGA